MYWTCELHGTTRVFDSGATCRAYAVDQLSQDGDPPVHLVDPDSETHILFTNDHLARIQPLRLQFAGNPGGHVVIIVGVES